MSEETARSRHPALRHALRTRLNHILGFGEILRQDASDEGRGELEAAVDRIRETAISIRDLLALRFSDEALASPPQVLESRDRDIFGRLYELIARIQDAKQRADAALSRDASQDVEKILEAANGLVELLASEGPIEEPVPLPEAASGWKAETSAEEETTTGGGRILVVDDNLFNRELLARHLERQGHSVRAAADGVEALRLIESEDFDIVVLDVMMPGMNGYQILERIKNDPARRDIHVIVISALQDTQSIARCIQLGAEDYLPREFEPVILKARIESCLEKKKLKAEQELYISALIAAQERLRSELRGGASYVRNLLPQRLEGSALRTDWMFMPSASLGGDVFGYHYLKAGPGEMAEDKALAIYMIDVSGHGIESALFSVTLMNTLKSQNLPATDFHDPVSVLSRLNASFRMEEQNNLYFTAWYGVWDLAEKALTYASAGSPPAVLVLPGGGAVELETGGPSVGIDTEAVYRVGKSSTPPGSRLFIFSDGIYEIRTKAGVFLGLEPFIGILSSHAAKTRSGSSALDGVLKDVQAVAAKSRFSGDGSLMGFDRGCKPDPTSPGRFPRPPAPRKRDGRLCPEARVPVRPGPRHAEHDPAHIRRGPGRFVPGRDPRRPRGGRRRERRRRARGRFRGAAEALPGLRASHRLQAEAGNGGERSTRMRTRRLHRRQVLPDRFDGQLGGRRRLPLPGRGGARGHGGSGHRPLDPR
jgi:sigma-B regulation protein RsbU (phosphoserine phosphatase)